MLAAMTDLMASKFWRREAFLDGPWQVIGWWETRRLAFNLIVGSVGVVTSVLIGVVALGGEILFNGEIGVPDPPIFVVFFALICGFVANVLYTGGWLCELLVRLAWPRQADRFATITMSSGLVFSVLLTASPGVLVVAAGAFVLIKHLIGATHG